jgi:vitamin B12 transporter
MMKITQGTVALILSLAASGSMHAQSANTGAQVDAFDEALQSCSKLAEAAKADGADKKAAKLAGERAEKLHRARLKANPADAEARVGLASVLSRCRTPFANIMQIMSIVDESIQLLEKVLASDSTHWQARMMLAMNYYHMPSFLGKTDDAVREFERLLAQQGQRADRPYLAIPYIYLGDLYRRAGREPDAAALWSRGAALFPDNDQLKERLAKLAVHAAAAPAAAPVPAEPVTVAPQVPVAAGAPAAAAAPVAAPQAAAQHEKMPVYALAPLAVEASNHQLNDARSGTALKRLDIVTIAGGTGEMLQALQTLPGVTRANDGSDLHVRGGDAAETAVVLDGGRVPYAGRWETLNGSAMGVLDAMVLRRTYFSAGGFSAKYGNALSGVVDVETDGRPAESGWGVNANMVQLGGNGRTRIGKNAGVWGVASVTDVTLLTKTNGESDLYPVSPHSKQAVAGFTVEPRKGMELRGVALSMHDRATREVDAGGYHGTFESLNSTQHVALSARALRSDGKAAVTSSVTASDRTNGYDFGVLDRRRHDRAFSARLDGDWAPAIVRVRAGMEAAALDAVTDGQVPTTSQVAPGSPAARLDDSKQSTGQLGGYIEAEHAFGNGFVLAAGARADRLPGESSVTFDPRIALAYSTGDWTMRLGGGVYHQGRWRLRYRLPDSGAPGGIPTRAQHLVAGIEKAGEPSVRIESYIKTYGDYVPEGDGPQVINAHAGGLDAIVRWTRQSLVNGWVTYSLTRGRMGLTTGNDVPSLLDVTHTFTGVGRMSLGADWELGATARYATGRPYTPVLGATVSEVRPTAPVFGDVNGARLPELVRLDARITRYVRMPRAFAVFYVEMLNLLDRRNVISYTYDASYTEQIPVHSFYAHRTFVLGVDLRSIGK